ncbi:hypothetical protein [Mycobacteroides abscessus]|uniref:Uncharacterized protein n=1 Tax=Mycobacteroides abscessus subsp. bolletii CRM-0020 TaxID=1306401 RepID=A0A829HM36_9MYCO|nr:hypothetical protein [Mycobacteroides abscessus]EPQ20954.1 hypothetical protein J108_23360 [Mycobacteroides abscessus subsp. bolletii CRM-0020]RIS37839.1 hypothetical protein D2E71_24715 [Mycobacteroides abscessus]RIS70530.1 hypothetical protein D2E54_24270 [Mycobacteroides abscessus]SIA41720.1 Uncharacterised protein [Mycobacteroides abscessus subsp. abscessus]SIA57320.1 Uncharacterised protein [Mycobacteroides abscessus subsp. abscessus]
MRKVSEAILNNLTPIGIAAAAEQLSVYNVGDDYLQKLGAVTGYAECDYRYVKAWSDGEGHIQHLVVEDEAIDKYREGLDHVIEDVMITAAARALAQAEMIPNPFPINAIEPETAPSR